MGQNAHGYFLFMIERPTIYKLFVVTFTNEIHKLTQCSFRKVHLQFVYSGLY